MYLNTHKKKEKYNPQSCDWCGESKFVIKSKKHFPLTAHWKNVYLCIDCIVKAELENSIKKKY